MSEPIHSRNVAQYLCTLATLLEAEAMKASALGFQSAKHLGSEACCVRELSNRLWEANTTIRFDYGDAAGDTELASQIAAGSPSDFDAVQPRRAQQPGRRGRRNQMKLVSS